VSALDRKWIQAAAALLTNIHLPNFLKGSIYQGKGVGVMADTTSRWFDGNAGGVACTFEREHTGALTYRFTRTANGWEYETFGTRPSYYDAKPIINAILNYIVTGNTTKEYNPS